MGAGNTTSHGPLAHRAEILACKGPVVAFHMKAWKHPFLQQFFPQKRFHFVPFQLTRHAFRRKVLPLLQAPQTPVVFVWSNNLPDFAAQEITRLGLTVFFMEDGFIRSLEAHAGYSVPLSLSLDSNRPYFDSRGESDLENLLRHYDFENDPALMQRARQGMQTVLEQRLTKYNGRPTNPQGIHPSSEGAACFLSLPGRSWPEAPNEGASPPHLSTPATTQPQPDSPRKRVLVIGQVEEDASILYGCDRPLTNNDLVRMAAAENPQAEIVYKPHPDVLSRMRREISNPDDVAHLCTIVKGQMSLPDALDAADQVYTITSLAGFEALMRGKKVTTIGAPFYAGWGLTDDRQPIPRRGRNLSVEALFAAAYILYPLYFDPATGNTTSFEETIASLKKPETKPHLSSAGRVKWQPYGTYGLLGWRHLLTPIVARVVAKVGNERDVVQYRSNPAGFFRELSDTRFQVVGMLLYPWE